MTSWRPVGSRSVRVAPVARPGPLLVSVTVNVTWSPTLGVGLDAVLATARSAREFDTVKAAVRSGDKVGWPNFGAFSATDRKARTGRNPRTGATVEIKAAKMPKFRAGKALKDAIN